MNWSRAAMMLMFACWVVSLCRVGPVNASSEPSWPASSIIYTIYPSIFSTSQNFTGITAQLPRLHRLGVTDIWIMPITPVGKAINGHPSVNSPYCVHDYFAINPQYGSSKDLTLLVSVAHKLGMRVLLDEVLNHTSWDNSLITLHPDYYVHTDANTSNPDSIKMAFNFSDVAQLNYANPGLRRYILGMLQYWIRQYHVDGFRFDTADDPDGPQRMIPADFWSSLGNKLREIDPKVLLLGECETPDLAMKPFALDYGWWMYSALKSASTGGDASQVGATWEQQALKFPAGMKHMTVNDDWDMPRDVSTFGGDTGATAAAVFSFTNTGVPLIYNGMEIGNKAQGVNPHAEIDWASGNAEFTSFYHNLISFRLSSPAVLNGDMTWLQNTEYRHVIAYTRGTGNRQVLVEINLSISPATGTIMDPIGGSWIEVKSVQFRDPTNHPLPPTISLGPREFAIYERTSDPDEKTNGNR